MSRNSENDSGGFHLQLTQPMELSLLASTAEVDINGQSKLEESLEEKQSNGLKFSIDFARWQFNVIPVISCSDPIKLNDEFFKMIPDCI
jgi:hypothetical protein